MVMYRRLNRVSCETCRKSLIHSNYGTYINISNPEEIVSFCSRNCFEYFVEITNKDNKIIDDLIHGIPDIEDNKN